MGTELGTVTTGATMSFDGYISGPDESSFDLLFQRCEQRIWW